MLTEYDIVVMCKKNNFFTKGDQWQYNRLLEIVRTSEDIYLIAHCIWMCSTQSFEEIKEAIDTLYVQKVFGGEV